MTLVGIDDTDSRTEGMCTTYAAHRLARRLRSAGADIDRPLLVRLNPAVEFKTRGNAALAVHADADPDRALELAREVVIEGAVLDGDRTNPGVVVADADPDAVPEAVAAFARRAVRDHLDPDRARRLAAGAGYDTVEWGTGRGLVGALAAVGAWRARGGAGADWTYERVAYRPRERWGTGRRVDVESVFAAADRAYPAAWDTVDRTAGEAVCVPNSPGPVLYGIRGDDPETVESVAADVAAEPTVGTETFRTNQGTDDHLRGTPFGGTTAGGAGVDGATTGGAATDGAATADPPTAEGRSAAGRPADGAGTAGAGSGAYDPGVALGAVRNGRAYRTTATVVAPPETRRGGHVFCAVADRDPAAVRAARRAPGKAVDPAGLPADGAGRPDPDASAGVDTEDGDGPTIVELAAFEPTKRFRDRVRSLRVGDRLTACGEASDGTLKVEKFALRDAVGWVPATPNCPDCGRSMESAGADAGYRCRDCSTATDGRVRESVERSLPVGWHEVPPLARRHVAKPLVRGGFDAPTHPER